MTHSPIMSLWLDLWADLRNPDFIWQLAAVAVCVAAGWGIARLLRARIEGRELHLRMVRIGMESFARVLPPLLTLLLIVLVKPVLALWHHVNLLRLAIPRRVYTHRHIDYLVEAILEVNECRHRIRGLEIVWEPPALSHFSARFRLGD